MFGNVRKELEQLRKILPKSENATMAGGNNDWVRQIKKEIEVLLGREETMWAQRSRLLWARQGKGTKTQNIFIALPRRDI